MSTINMNVVTVDSPNQNGSHQKLVVDVVMPFTTIDLIRIVSYVCLRKVQIMTLFCMHELVNVIRLGLRLRAPTMSPTGGLIRNCNSMYGPVSTITLLPMLGVMPDD